ncbi:MAG: hypothetical protein JWO03_2551 [Bacteroidetes bacterium]|nr:hypothetical protein [Bacteroidota bacterium]
MQNCYKIYFLVLIVLLALSPTRAQQSNKALDYMAKVTDGQRQITSEMLGYVSAVAHNKSAKKVSKQRSEAMAAISSARAKALHMSDFEGDSALRVASYNYFNICYIVMKEDYGKIMDLEEISEQSYDNMEAYIKAQEVANEKRNEAFDKADREIKAFAVKHNINLTEDKSEEGKQSEIVSNVTKYYNKVYLTFFKCNSDENYLIKAVDKKDINGVEQNKNALIKHTDEALPKLTEIGNFENDASLINSCKKLLDFYKIEAEKKTPTLTDFIVKSDNFQKLKTAMDKKGSGGSQSEVDEFNKSVKDMNGAVVVYNKTNNELNENRSKLINDWNNAYMAFMSKHIPHHK